MIGLRSAMFAAKKSSAPTARDYVQDGLIAMWHGIENAGWGVHDATATVWKDLIGSFDINLNNLEVGEDHIILNGGRGTASNWITSPIVHMEFVEVHTKQGLLAQFGNNSFNHQIFVYPATAYNFSQASNRCAAPTTTGVVNCVSVEYDTSVNNGEVASAIVNGKSASLMSRQGNSGFGGLMIGGASDTYMVIEGKLYCMRLYSRALTAEEIAHNYAIDKAMFNLP